MRISDKLTVSWPVVHSEDPEMKSSPHHDFKKERRLANRSSGAAPDHERISYSSSSERVSGRNRTIFKTSSAVLIKLELNIFGVLNFDSSIAKPLALSREFF